MKRFIKIILILIIITICGILGFFLTKTILKKSPSKAVQTISYEEEKQIKDEIIQEQPKIKSVKISAVGDCTIGWDSRYNASVRFDTYLEKNDGDYSYYFKKVKPVFDEDDLTIINLEGTFTTYNVKVPKSYNFSAPPDYKNVLTTGAVDVVSFANNHTHDFGIKGYEDTLQTLSSIQMPYYGYDNYLVKIVNGIKIGFFALSDIDCENYKDIDVALEYLKEQECDLIISSMHWGIEGDHKQSAAQIKMAHYMIDNGVDLILGSHPHRLQGIEKYKDRYIVYSMANFCFGGNTNPEYKDSMIFQETFTFDDGILQLDDNINIIPVSVSGVKTTNNYQPIVLEGVEAKQTMNKILRYSTGFEYDKTK